MVIQSHHQWISCQIQICVLIFVGATKLCFIFVLTSLASYQGVFQGCLRHVQMLAMEWPAEVLNLP